MQVMILAAGRSTRLGALGMARPKPLVPICGYPAITYGLALCAQAGLRNVVINLHHHADQIRAVVGDGSAYGVRVRYSVEEELLGTGGGIAKARPLFEPGPLLVMNGKVVADADLRAVIASHGTARSRPTATMVLRSDPEPDRFAPVTVDDTGRVIGLRGKRGPTTVCGVLSDQMFTGIHVLEPELIDRLPVGASDIIGDAYQPALEDGARIHSMMLTGYFEEHSTPTRYLAGNMALLRHPSLVKVPPGPLTGIDSTARIDPAAIIHHPVRMAAGVVVEAGAIVGPDVVLGAGATVTAGAQIQRSVVWEGAVVRGKIDGAVITAEAVIDPQSG